MIERVKEIPAVKQNDGSLLIDLAQEGSPFLEGLLEPIRTVDVRVGSVVYRMPRGANDTTPDNVVQVGSMWTNMETGRAGFKLEDALGEK